MRSICVNNPQKLVFGPRTFYISLNWFLFLLINTSLFFVKVEGNCYSLSDKNVDSQTAIFEFRCNEERAKLTSRFQKFRKEGEFSFSEPEDSTPSGAIYLSKAIRHLTLKVSHLTRLSDLLGENALALNLAAITLDNKKISVEDYIKEIEERTANNSELQENDKYLYKAISVAMKMLKHEEGSIGKLAFKVLSILGYLPDCHDRSKDSDFLASVTKSNISEVHIAADVLQKYGLIQKILNDGDAENDKILTFVNPVFLPIIRYEGRHERQKTFEMVVNCSGFQEYKYAAMEFADEDLQNKYPEIKSVLIDHSRLKNVAEDEKYEDALKLSAGIHEVMRTRETLYNYGKIMEYSGNITGALDIFQCLYTHFKTHSNFISSDILSFWDDYSDKEIVDIKHVRLDGRIVEGNLLLLLFKTGNKNKIKEVLMNRTDFFMLPKRIQETLNVLELITDLKYELIDEFDWPPYNKFNSLIVGKDNVENKVILHKAHLSSNIKWPSNLKYLKLYEPTFSDTKGNTYSEFDVSSTIRTNLTRFTLSYDNPRQNGTKLKVSLHKLANVSEIILADGIIISLKRKEKISPRLLEWGNVSFIQPSPRNEKILLNDFVDFSRIKKLKIHDGTQKQLKIDLSDPVTIDDLLLNGIQVSNCKNASWTVKNLYLRHMKFLRPTNMNVRQLEIITSAINLSALPKTIEKITIWEDAAVSTDDNNMCLPNLRTLVFGHTNYYNTLPMFSNCSSLINLEFKHMDPNFHSNTQLKLNTENISKTVRNIKSSYNILTEGEKDLYLDKLILERNLDDWNSIPPKLKPDHIILKANQLDVNNKALFSQLLNLLERFKILTIGECNWLNTDFENSLLSKIVDTQSKYYTFENNTGYAIDWTSFAYLSYN